MSAAADVGFEITLKPRPAPPPPFTCCVCRRQVEPDRWGRGEGKPPVCDRCASSWGRPFRLNSVARTDHGALARLKAVTAALDWEVKNGRRG